MFLVLDLLVDSPHSSEIVLKQPLPKNPYLARCARSCHIVDAEIKIYWLDFVTVPNLVSVAALHPID